ncbi:hypothetical protein [Cellvibrio sp. OA-2007]|uniref:hypothetical protein n=1 Tax=Cellvibrio sp. OA-2007 TaxID=529823 RepID=UPI000782F69E|nr:hypothetical protein [Cellvibrio sp. OA-2007]
MKTLRTSQVNELLEINSQTLRVWTNTLPPFSLRNVGSRKARTYSAQDALFFLIVKFLSRDLGIQVSSIAAYSSGLLSICMHKPLGELCNDTLVIFPLTQSTQLVASTNQTINTYEDAVVIVPLKAMVDRIFCFLTGDVVRPVNLEIPFPLQAVRSNEKRA